jgi:hypothetical protein
MVWVMDALTALRSKRDTRSYRPDPIDDATLDQVLDAARMAGSAKNRQPVRMVVVTDLDTKTPQEGDMAKEGPNKGRRAVNGWKNNGLPWSYDLDKSKLLINE